MIVVLLAAALAVRARLPPRARASRAGRGPGVGHWLPYGAGLLVLALALMSPLDAIGDSYLLSAHMGAAPAALGCRAGAARARPAGAGAAARPDARAGCAWSRPAAAAAACSRSLTSPWVALPLWAAATWIWAIPAVFDYSAAHPVVHAFEHATLFYTGLAMWWLIIDPLPSARRAPNARRLAYLGFTRLASAVRLPAARLHDEHRRSRATSPRRAPTASARSPTSTSPAPACASSSS